MTLSHSRSHTLSISHSVRETCLTTYVFSLAVWESVRVKSEVVDNMPRKSRIFIDDGLFFWFGSGIDLTSFLEFLNARDTAIKITWEFDFQKREVNFLDLRIWVDEAGFVQTDLFRKPNSKNNYLLSSSCHPEHIFKNIPYSLCLLYTSDAADE